MRTIRTVTARELANPPDPETHRELLFLATQVASAARSVHLVLAGDETLESERELARSMVMMRDAIADSRVKLSELGEAARYDALLSQFAEAMHAAAVFCMTMQSARYDRQHGSNWDGLRDAMDLLPAASNALSEYRLAAHSTLHDLPLFTAKHQLQVAADRAFLGLPPDPVASQDPLANLTEPVTPTYLAKKYGVSRKTIGRWLKPHTDLHLRKGSRGIPYLYDKEKAIQVCDQKFQQSQESA